jgi:hypothetical protein
VSEVIGRGALSDIEEAVCDTAFTPADGLKVQQKDELQSSTPLSGAASFALARYVSRV